MSLFAKVVTTASIDVITELNDGVRPHRETLNGNTFFVYGDGDNDMNLLIDRETFEHNFKWRDDSTTDNEVVAI